MARLKIVVELTVDNFEGQVMSDQRNSIKLNVEKNINSPALSDYLHGLGTYTDAEVIEINYIETYDTRN